MAALGALYAAYYARLEHYITRQCGGTLDAQDLAQDVFIRLLETHARYEIQRPTHAYLLTVAKRVVAQHRRNQVRRRHRLALASIPEDPVDPHGQNRGECLDDTAWQEFRGVVEDTIVSLTPKAREAIRLRFVQGLSTVEAARVAGCSINAFYSRLERALRSLRRRHGDRRKEE